MTRATRDARLSLLERQNQEFSDHGGGLRRAIVATLRTMGISVPDGSITENGSVLSIEVWEAAACTQQDALLARVAQLNALPPVA